MENAVNTSTNNVMINSDENIKFLKDFFDKSGVDYNITITKDMIHIGTITTHEER